MSARDRSLVVLACLLGLASVILAGLVAPEYGVAALWVLAIDMFLVAGTWVVVRRPDSRSARTLFATGLVATTWYCLGMVELLWFAEYGATTGLLVLNVVVLAFDVALPASVLALLATYPDRRPRGVTRLVMGVGLAWVPAVPLLALLGGAELVPSYVLVWNEGVESLPGLFSTPDVVVAREIATAAHEMALAVLPLAGAAVLIGGYRRLAGPDRVRVRWLGLAGLVVAIDGVFTGVPEINVIPAGLSIALIGSFPLLAAVGIARPDLLDIDDALRRTVLFGALWAASSIAYVALANALGLAAGDRGAAAAVPAAVAATIAFYPAWQALVRLLARRFFGVTLDGDELLRRVGQALEHTLEPVSLAQGLAEAIRDGLGVTWVRVRLDDQPVVAAGDPAESSTEPAIRTELVHEGHRLGWIECGPTRSGRTLRAADRQRLELLGRQLGLAAHHAYQAAELAASRSRLVAAEERGRRRIQRDIHDGVQQDLVALIGQVGLLEAKARRDPDAVLPQLAQLRADTGAALEDLRDLAQGIHPSVLADHGLVEAIESRASSLPIGVTIEGSERLRGVRLPPVVESALYFTTSEAITNAIKHAGAEQVRISVQVNSERVRLEVTDDGRGFEPGSGTGSGLEGLADRLEALDGTLAVVSRPGHGTTLRAELPLEPEVTGV